jgi:DNA adenine methylase
LPSKSDEVDYADTLAQPFLKWPGGKRWLWKTLQALVPTNFNTYFEPFLGGGAIFFSLSPNAAVLSDINPELINAHAQIRDNVEAVIARLKRLSIDRESYRRIRAASFESHLSRAVRFIYLSKTAFNGMYRVNRQGDFNVPFAGQLNRKLFDSRVLRVASQRLKGCSLLAQDFSESLKAAKRGDLVYCDPPYTVLHNNNGFLRYNERLFSWSDQGRLAELARAAVGRGAFVLVSNAGTEHVRLLYQGFHTIPTQRASCVSASTTSRGQVSEFLFVGRPKKV